MSILFAFVAFFGEVLSTLLLKLQTEKKQSTFMIMFIKSIYLAVFSFVFALFLNNGIVDFINLTPTQWLYLGLTLVTGLFNFLFFMMAMRRSNLYGFAPFCQSGQLFLSNLSYLIFFTGLVTNGSKTLNLILYILGLACLAGSALIIILNKFLNKNCDKKWLIYSLISSLFFATTMTLTRFGLGGLNAGVISFYNAASLLLVGFIGLIVTKTLKDFKKITAKGHLELFLYSIGQFLITIGIFLAQLDPGANPTLNTTIHASSFVLISVISLIRHKEKFNFILWIITGIMFSGMVLAVLASIL